MVVRIFLNRFFWLVFCVIIGALVVSSVAGPDESLEPTGIDAPHLLLGTDNINSCDLCHVEYLDRPEPVTEDWISFTKCQSCHVESGSATPAEVHVVPGDTIWCETCHDPHHHQDVWPHKYIATDITTPSGPTVSVVFGDAMDFIHGDPDYDGICEICHTSTSYHRNNATGDHTHNADTKCTDCHSHAAGFGGFGGDCSSCHGAPPPTAAHLMHFGGEAGLASYGGTDNHSLDTAYIFGCGTCHPLSGTQHQNGTVDVELYNAAAPGSSLKGLSPPSASYTPGGTVYTDAHGISYTHGTCSDVYCHSRTDWLSPDPISQPTGVDSNGNFTYDPYVVTEFKVYADVNWGGASPGCNGCHRNMPQTSYPDVQAGVGNSHAWIDGSGWENLHAFNMSFDPLVCRICHYSTVTDSMSWTRQAGTDISTYDDVAIASKAYHVNGVKDVAFDPVNPVTYNSTYYMTGVTYNPATKTCSNPPCHLNQTTPEWGKPYRSGWGSQECNLCHQYKAPAGESGTLKTRSGHPVMLGKDCVDCHDGHRRMQ